MRCFVAVDVPAEVRVRVAAVAERLRRAAPRADVRWVAADTVHLTLKFLGEVDDARVPAVERVLGIVAVAQAPLVLTATGLGGFPDGARPRVIHAGIEGDVGELTRLAAAVDAATGALGVPVERRVFRAHLTLGRVRTPRGGDDLAAALRAEGAAVLGTWTAAEMVLYRSLLRPTGAVHEARARLVLGRRGPGDP